MSQQDLNFATNELNALHLEDDAHPPGVLQPTEPQPETKQRQRRQDIVQGLDPIISSFQNKQISRIQALTELLNIINQQDHLSDFQKGQLFDNYLAQVNDIEASRNSKVSYSAEIRAGTSSVPSRSSSEAKAQTANFVEYKPLPENYQDTDHYWFYGWVLTEAFKRGYLVKRQMPVPDCMGDITLNVVDDIERRVQYKLCLVGVQPDEITDAQGKFRGEWETKDFDAVAVTCSKSKRLLNQRPNQEQMDKLTEIFGEEPRWLKDSSQKKDFDLELWML